MFCFKVACGTWRKIKNAKVPLLCYILTVQHFTLISNYPMAHIDTVKLYSNCNSLYILKTCLFYADFHWSNIRK